MQSQFLKGILIISGFSQNVLFFQIFVVNMKFMQHSMHNWGKNNAHYGNKNISPLNRAYAEANIFALTLVKVLTGPMPPKIIEAFSNASTQLSPAIQ
jgi:hypothetical protein